MFIGSFYCQQKAFQCVLVLRTALTKERVEVQADLVADPNLRLRMFPLPITETGVSLGSKLGVYFSGSWLLFKGAPIGLNV